MNYSTMAYITFIPNFVKIANSIFERDTHTHRSALSTVEFVTMLPSVG
jgi:hypothetical protein